MNDSGSVVSSDDNIVNNTENPIKYTETVPNDYLKPSEKQGVVRKITYETRNYVDGGDETITKPANVYLPYGYNEGDENKRYNIFYFMRGWTGNADEFFNFEDQAARNILDHLIENNKMEPTIVVAATFDEKNQSASFSRSVQELTVFHEELENELIPAIENQFHTYAETTDKKGQIASRDRRGFGGFSLGAVTTWYSYIYNLDSFRYFLPMSGDSWIIEQYGGRTEPQETAHYIEKVARDSPYGKEGFFVYAATGTNDAVFDQVDGQMQAMLKMTDTFTEDNFVYRLKKDGYHDFEAVYEYLYNGLPVFFPKN